MRGNHKKIVGYFAFKPRTLYSVCDGDACVIAGSKEAMGSYISKLSRGKVTDYSVKKTRYGEILQGLQKGAAYAFDKMAYKSFYPLAKAEGLKVVEFQMEDNSRPNDDAVPLMRVKWIDMA